MNISKLKYLTAAAAIVFVVLFCAFAVSEQDNDKFALAKQEMMLRKIGHQLLLKAGDSTSRVLPIVQVGENEFQIRFERQLSFEADTLAKIVDSELAAYRSPGDYVVSVLSSKMPGVVFGYSMLRSEKDSTRACSGRIQPKDSYKVNILFKERGMTTMQKSYLIGGLPVLAFIGLLLYRRPKQSAQMGAAITESPNANENIAIGTFQFYINNRHLINNGDVIDLTVKETKLLCIFASEQGEIIPRARLQKELWEDEGVIVGRSLDVFISKLRKKLEADPAVKLVNIHGKGFRLEVGVAV
ncbi:winged helix-turn-helix domain-containing protein [Mucilaginibacter myungsuensis]|uniref:Winged helix-turn-helix transcriptional regulator n=1 Tax=Mucilaginibacter myungsuensis TaxID=649104 RepID=A0A929KX64_9SPHI|nr:winged helix-turn-helix domain-containing protein [Mucilaginibacter myungsuensis]MBE9662098.1 winged helix-turn-helix transcriptional regulator [Mucilaginibacter myungsuensis]MDN3599468.1 winged helix-turn-helix domain-containing protein [Mucilaginibacter myungsuensis]